jgi:hypothetical protein
VTDDERIAAATARHQAAAHAMQSGVKHEMHYRSQPTDPKHLRTGINAAMADMGGLVKLLIAKGVITEVEYTEAIAESMEAEKARYEAHLTALMGRKVTLL